MLKHDSENSTSKKNFLPPKAGSHMKGMRWFKRAVRAKWKWPETGKESGSIFL